MSKAIETAVAWVETQPEAVREAYKQILEDPEAATELGGHILRQNDYTAKTMEVSEQAKKNAAYRQELVTWQEKANAERDNALKQVEALRVEKAALASRVQRLGTKYNIEEDDLNVLPDTQETAPKEEKVLPNNEEDLREYADKTALNAVSVAGALFKLNSLHARLGIEEDFDPEELIQGALTNGKSIEDFYSEKFDVPAKQAALSAAAVAEREEAIRAEERTKVQSEYSAEGFMPGSSSDRPGGGSPLLALAGGDRPLGDGPGDDPDRGVKQAVAAFNQKLYEDPAGRHSGV